MMIFEQAEESYFTYSVQWFQPIQGRKPFEVRVYYPNGEDVCASDYFGSLEEAIDVGKFNCAMMHERFGDVVE